MGGWAPYFSFAGILRSSTKTHSRLPGVGPYLLRLRLLNTYKCMLIDHRTYENKFLLSHHDYSLKVFDK